MSVTDTTKPALDGNGNAFDFGFVNVNGSFVPKHAPIGLDGNRIDPVKDSTVSAVTTSLGSDGDSPPTLPGNATGVRGWLRAIVAVLTGTLSVVFTNTSIGVVNAKRIVSGGTISNTNDTVILTADNMSTAALQLSGTWAGSISVFGSMDGGASYPIAVSMKPFGSGGGPAISAFVANGNWDRSASGFTHLKVQATSLTSGSVNVILAAFNGGKFARVEAPVSDPLPSVLTAGTALIGKVGLQANGADVASSTPLPVLFPTDQDLVLDHANATKASVVASTSIFTPPTGCKYARFGTDVDVFIRTDNTAAGDDAFSARLIANQPEILPVVAGVSCFAATGGDTAVVRVTPFKQRGT